MGGSASYCSAVRLAECGAFIGKQIGGDYYFEPQKTLSRGEFTAMCLNVAGENVLRGVVSTGFTDDGSIPDWQRAYVASAVKDGVVKGREGAVFDAGADISRAEAAVMLDRLLSLADVSCADTDAVPTWAAQSAANLDACGIASLESVDSLPSPTPRPPTCCRRRHGRSRPALKTGRHCLPVLAFLYSAISSKLQSNILHNWSRV